MNRQGADKNLLILFPLIFIAVMVVFMILVWAFQKYIMPLFS